MQKLSVNSRHLFNFCNFKVLTKWFFLIKSQKFPSLGRLSGANGQSTGAAKKWPSDDVPGFTGFHQRVNIQTYHLLGTCIVSDIHIYYIYIVRN